MEKINRRSALMAAGAALAATVVGTPSESEAAGGLLGRFRFGQRSNQQTSQGGHLGAAEQAHHGILQIPGFPGFERTPLGF